MFGHYDHIFGRRDLPFGTGKWLVVISNICMSEACIINIYRILERFWIRFRISATHFSFRKTSFSMKSEMKNQHFYIKLYFSERARRCGHFGGAGSI